MNGAAYAGAYGDVMSGAYRPRLLRSAVAAAVDLVDDDLASSAAAAKQTIVASTARHT